MVPYVVIPTLPIVRTHLIINCVIALLVVIIVGLRILSRTYSGVKLGWDDIFVMLAVVCTYISSCESNGQDRWRF